MTTEPSDPIERLYRATATPELVFVPAITYLCADGHGDPNTGPEFAQAVQALYSVTYSAKFAIKRAHGATTKVSALEGLWWASEMSTLTYARREEWSWTAMIRQPALATAEVICAAVVAVQSKKPGPFVQDLRLRTLTEGPSAQVLHVGPYGTEEPTIRLLHAFIRERGFDFDGYRQKHHEIYLSDPRRTAPDRLRTIIRQPYTAE